MKISLRADRESIMRVLKQGDVSKKLHLFHVMRDLDDRERIRVLLKIMEDGSWIMRERAAQELVSFGAKVVPRLIRLCRSGYWFSRAAACRSLGAIGDLRALPPVVGLVLDDPNPTVVKEARQALTDLYNRDHDAFVHELSSFIEQQPDSPRSRSRIAEHLGDLFPEFAPPPAPPHG